ncbi:integrase [Halobacteriales archaeon SW_7_65_23]|nr:MAG: integrase [Halobacteriales archaeon SW_7_65_23]
MTSTQYIDISRSLENLENEVHSENAAAVKDLINHSAAEGVGESQQERIIYAWKTLLKKFASDRFRIRGATKDELKDLVAEVNRSDYAESTKHKFRCAIKKLYKVENGGEHPDKVQFFSVHKSQKPTSVTRDDLFTSDELQRLLSNFTNTRDRAVTYVLYESATRPGELLSASLGDFTTNEKGDFIFLQGAKHTPDRTNQLVRSGRTLREWIAQHPFGGETGNIQNPSKPLWVKTQQHACKHCGNIPQFHNDNCTYEPDPSDPLKQAAYRRRFKDACERAEIPENKRRPYNLRHTRLTEVATFMGYEQLNKFAGWKPGSDRAKVYVHLNNDDVNKAIREEYGLSGSEEEDGSVECPFCGAENNDVYSECRNCGRVLSLEEESSREEKQSVLERLEELDERGVLEKLGQLEG